jgi:hypothetical protein
MEYIVKKIVDFLNNVYKEEPDIMQAIEDAEKEKTLSFFYALLLMRKQEIQYMLEDLKNVMDEQERSKGEGN